MHLFAFVFIKCYIYEQKDTVYICTQTEYIIYTYIYICIYICIYTHIYVLIYTCVCVYDDYIYHINCYSSLLSAFCISPVNEKKWYFNRLLQLIN
jgi:hypothetical protein